MWETNIQLRAAFDAGEMIEPTALSTFITWTVLYGTYPFELEFKRSIKHVVPHRIRVDVVVRKNKLEVESNFDKLQSKDLLLYPNKSQSL